jgi:hypothetical protein
VAAHGARCYNRFSLGVTLRSADWLDTAPHVTVDLAIGTVEVALNYPLINSYPQASTAETGIINTVEETR